MDDLREFLKKAENQAREEMSNLNEALKHILLAQQLVDLEVEIPKDPPEEHPDPDGVPMLQVHGPEQRAKAERKWGADPTELELKHKTRYKGLTLSTCVVNVLKRMGEPVDSKKIHEELIGGGWKTDSKDSLGAVRNALVRLKGNIKSQKVNGIYHYSLLPIKELV